MPTITLDPVDLTTGLFAPARRYFRLDILPDGCTPFVLATTNIDGNTADYHGTFNFKWQDSIIAWSKSEYNQYIEISYEEALKYLGREELKPLYRSPKI